MTGRERNLFVANLAPTVTDADLVAIFGPFGSVSSVRVMKDGNTREHRGFGFVSYREEEQANAAMQALHGSILHGQRIFVSIAQCKRRLGAASATAPQSMPTPPAAVGLAPAAYVHPTAATAVPPTNFPWPGAQYPTHPPANAAPGTQWPITAASPQLYGPTPQVYHHQLHHHHHHHHHHAYSLQTSLHHPQLHTQAPPPSSPFGTYAPNAPPSAPRPL